MRHGVALIGSAALVVLGLVVAVLFGIIGRQYGAPCTTEVCASPGADTFLGLGVALILVGALALVVSLRSARRSHSHARDIGKP
jgi:hypothetical protein